MSTVPLSLFALGLYVAGAILLWLNLSSKLTISKFTLIFLGFLATHLHGYSLYCWIDTPIGQNLCINHLFSMVCWLMSIIALCLAFFKPIENLTVFVYPLSALSIVFVLLFPGQELFLTRNSLPILVHILISIVAFSLLCLAALQALLLYVQNHLIRQKTITSGAKFSRMGIIELLPPLQTMEIRLFQIIGFGFIFLSASVITALLVDNNLWVATRVQKLILSLLAWILFAVLLFNRYQFGLRGIKAIQWTLTGFGFLTLAYLGSKYVQTYV